MNLLLLVQYSYFWSIVSILFKCDIHHRLLPPPPSQHTAGVHLTADAVFKLLKKTNREWDQLALEILSISDSKHHEIAQRCSTEDDCLMESIQFWINKFPYASYRRIAFRLKTRGLGAISQEMHHLLEPIQGKNVVGGIVNITTSSTYY